MVISAGVSFARAKSYGVVAQWTERNMNCYWQLNDEEELLKSGFTQAVTFLRSPAGPQYQTEEAINRNLQEFGKAFHKGLFEFHCNTIEHILRVEERLRDGSNNQSPDEQLANFVWDRLRQILRTFNDCILWTTFSEPSFEICRLCRNRSRGFLSDQNPHSILKVLSDLSASGNTLAIWNDATRCIDLQDITALSLSPREMRFYEVKEGAVNLDILEVLEAKSHEAILSRMEDFFSRRGPKGLQQLERCIKQGINAEKAHALVANDCVVDPFSGVNRTVYTPKQPLTRYDSRDLNDLLREVRTKEFASTTVDNCLHILAVNQRYRRDGVSVDNLIDKELKTKMVKPSTDEPICHGLLISLQDTIYSPISMPVMMRPLDPEDIADICIGNILVLFMFDMNAWGKLFRKCRFSWSTLKEGRREKSKPFHERQMVVNDRIPMITSMANDRVIRLGDMIMPRLVCEGIAPSSMAQSYEDRFMPTECNELPT